MRLERATYRLRHAAATRLQAAQAALPGRQAALAAALDIRLRRVREGLERHSLRLDLLDPKLVLQRGYALLTDLDGTAISQTSQTWTGQALRATLADGEVDLTVEPHRLI